MSIKEKMILKCFKRVFKQIQTPETVFTEEWLKTTLKRTVNELYTLIPDRNFGTLSFTCFTEDGKTTNNYGTNVYYVDISFHDRYTKIPWLICRFYKQNAKVRFYLDS